MQALIKMGVVDSERSSLKACRVERRIIKGSIPVCFKWLDYIDTLAQNSGQDALISTYTLVICAVVWTFHANLDRFLFPRESYVLMSHVLSSLLAPEMCMAL